MPDSSPADPRHPTAAELGVAELAAAADLEAARRRLRAEAEEVLAGRGSTPDPAPTSDPAPSDAPAGESGSEVVAEPSPSAVVTLRRRGPDPLDTIADDTICVVSDLELWQWSSAEVAALAERLRPDRVLLFLEPTADLGWRQALHVLGRRWWRARLGHDFSADVPAALRRTGLVVTDVDRFTLGPLGTRSYVWGRARWLATPAEAPTG